jgi:hypothetical protein
VCNKNGRELGTAPGKPVPIRLVQRLAVATRDLIHVSEKAARLVEGGGWVEADVRKLREAEERLLSLRDEVKLAQGALIDFMGRN